MTSYAEPIERLINELTRLPGIGRKTAARLAFHILRIPKREAHELARGIIDVKEKIQLCSVCFNLTDRNPCRICNDFRRSDEVICVVEEPNDLMAIEGAGDFNGKYHVLHGTLSPLEGVGPEDIKAKELMERIAYGIPMGGDIEYTDGATLGKALEGRREI